jgi:hypothetical protein
MWIVEQLLHDGQLLIRQYRATFDTVDRHRRILLTAFWTDLNLDQWPQDFFFPLEVTLF